ncbi:MBOAT family O-acyltransferase [Leptospira idonii]|uniref:MBOAT family protein n=1 Tax=Leptospira idonii TaxID=1193500 RepID=A0A4R9M1P3_9LEPT|nr:MBOAT family O-acyltransferase [Leptospira idonii]TGN20694.1 MBOAT family protein [Leptospira idonii]
MLFNSLPFLTSFSFFFAIYLFLSKKHQNILLLLYGLYFYSYWNWKMTFLLLFSILVNFAIGIAIDTQQNPSSKKRVLVAGIAFNLLLLGWFKYLVFVLGLFEDGIRLFEPGFSIWKPEILLPVGVSFYTFHNISYLVEIHSSRISASRNFISFAVYDIFFPLLLAGPIERPNSLLPQLEKERKTDTNSFFSGMSLFVWGIFLKTVIADPLAKFVDGALVAGGELPPGILWMVAPAFAFQVYADFSGYSNCARGLAEMMGFKLMNNFHRPFFASNPSQFWQRWHISLSSWLRDYVYIPLGGNRFGFFKQNLNIMFVWLLGGLWHGATYGYLIWGIYLGACIVLYNLTKKLFLSRLSFESILLTYLGRCFTFLSFAFGLLLFRVNDPSELIRYLRNIFSFGWETLQWSYVFLFMIPILVFDYTQEKKQTLEADWEINTRPYRFLFFFFVLFVLFALVSPFDKQEFFYFQF